MHKQFNYKVGDIVTHHIFGTGKVVEITDSYTVVDYSEKPGFKQVNSNTGTKITIDGKPAIETVYDGPIGNYEIAFEYHARPTHQDSSNTLRSITITISGKSEADAVKEVYDRVTAYKNYDGGFYINSVSSIE